MPSDKRDRLNMARAYGLGFNFVAGFGVFAFLGWSVDWYWGTDPWGVITGATLGLIGSTYNLIKASYSAFEDSSDRRRDRDEQSDQRSDQ
jgi:F0F1-type ATP synthase assembly protein I